MNKAELIAELQAQLGSGCSHSHAERALSAVLASIAAGLQRDGTVQITGFGCFSVRERKARTGRNPVTKEPIAISASRSVGFRPGSSLKSSF